MSPELFFGLYVFMLAGFVGYGVIGSVPPLLHTPLMAFTNAISEMAAPPVIIRMPGHSGDSITVGRQNLL